MTSPSMQDNYNSNLILNLELDDLKQDYNLIEIHNKIKSKAADAKTFEDDLEAILKIFFSEGPNIIKIKKHVRDKKTLEKLEYLISTYDIKGGVRGSNNAETIITMSRIASAFPCMALTVLHKYKVMKPIAIDLPPAMCCYQALSFYDAIPFGSTPTSQMYRFATLYYLVVEFKQYSPIHKNKSNAEVRGLIEPFVRGAEKSNFAGSIKEKLALLKKVGIYPANSFRMRMIRNMAAKYITECGSWEDQGRKNHNKENGTNKTV